MLKFSLNGLDYRSSFEYKKHISMPVTMGQTLVTNTANVPFYNIDTVNKLKYVEPELCQYDNVRLIKENFNYQENESKKTFVSIHTSSYHHFLIDTIGGILFLYNKNVGNFDIKTIVQVLPGWENFDHYKKSFVKNFHQDIFNYLNLGVYENTLIDITDNKFINIDKLVTVNYPSAPLDSFYPVLNVLRNKLMKKNKQYRKIYITRKDIKDANKKRNIVDDEILQKYFYNFGYETVHFEEMSFAEQLDIVSSSTHIICHNGSSMVNTLFSQDGTQIFEIRNSVLQQHDAYMFWSEWFNKKHKIIKCFGATYSQEIIDAIEFDDQIIL